MLWLTTYTLHDFGNNEHWTNKLKTAFPDATVHTGRLPPMWTLQNPLVIEKPE